MGDLKDLESKKAADVLHPISTGGHLQICDIGARNHFAFPVTDYGKGYFSEKRNQQCFAVAQHRETKMENLTGLKYMVSIQFLQFWSCKEQMDNKDKLKTSIK